MKRSLFTQLAGVLLFSLLLGLSPTQAQDEDNLLTNPGFEDPFQTFPGEPDRLVASGWNPWHVPRTPDMASWQNAQPEYEEASPDVTRIRSGENAQLFFNTFFTHEGGVWQRVTDVQPGTELRFSVYAYIWSSTLNDVNESEDPGDVIVQVGIDPTGGTDGTSDDIIWSPPAPDQYDAYRQYSVIATAANSAVTVWVRSRIAFPAQNNYIYLDDAELTIVSQPEPVVTDTPADQGILPTNTPGGEDPTPTREGEDATATDLPTDVPPPTETPLPTVTDAPPTNTPVMIFDDTPTPLPPTATAQPTETAVDETAPAIGGPVTGEFPGTVTHRVRRGDTVGRLAALYGSTIDAILAANDLGSDALIFVGDVLLIPVPIAAPATSTPSPTSVVVVIVVTATPPNGDPGEQFGTGGPLETYIVRPGDTLLAIARRFGTTVAALARANGIVNVNRIDAGQQLVIPGTSAVPPTATPIPDQPQTYVVRPGDNLYRISLRFGVTMLELVQANNLGNVNLIYAGQVLRIPS
jgi:LysM repeat protein